MENAEKTKTFMAYTAGHNLQIVKNHFIPGSKVKKYSDISGLAIEMLVFLEGGISKGEYSTGYALAHNQVEDKNPMSFFVVDRKYVKKDGTAAQMFEHFCIMNPEILEAPGEIAVDLEGKDKRKNTYTVEEGCFSFPFRQPKKVERFFKIKVRYYITGSFFGLKKIEKWIDGLTAHVFQHELDHCEGRNIYFVK